MSLMAVPILEIRSFFITRLDFQVDFGELIITLHFPKTSFYFSNPYTYEI